MVRVSLCCGRHTGWRSVWHRACDTWRILRTACHLSAPPSSYGSLHRAPASCRLMPYHVRHSFCRAFAAAVCRAEPPLRLPTYLSPHELLWARITLCRDIETPAVALAPARMRRNSTGAILPITSPGRSLSRCLLHRISRGMKAAMDARAAQAARIASTLPYRTHMWRHYACVQHRTSRRVATAICLSV